MLNRQRIVVMCQSTLLLSLFCTCNRVYWPTKIDFINILFSQYHVIYLGGVKDFSFVIEFVTSSNTSPHANDAGKHSWWNLSVKDGLQPLKNMWNPKPVFDQCTWIWPSFLPTWYPCPLVEWIGDRWGRLRIRLHNNNNMSDKHINYLTREYLVRWVPTRATKSLWGTISQQPGQNQFRKSSFVFGPTGKRTGDLIIQRH